MFKKHFTALGLILIIISVLLTVSCEKQPDTTPIPPADTSAQESAASPQTLVKDGAANYAIVLPAASNGPIRTAANNLCSDLGKLFGVKFTVKSNHASTDDSQRKILIGAGAGNRQTLAYHQYSVTLSPQGDIVISAWTGEAISTACGKLMMKIKAAVKDGDSLGTVNEGLCFDGIDTGIMQTDLPVLLSDKTPLIYHVQGARGAFELYFNSCTDDHRAECAQKLTAVGYSLLQSRELTDACFEVYQKNGLQVTVSFWHATGELIVLADKPSYTTPLSAETVSSTTSPKLISVGQEYPGALKGMCYILQASDGSFVIIDSGEGEDAFLDRIYELMTSNLPEGARPHIRAWFITHQHGDHTGGIINFASSKYASRVDCDAIYSNMPYEKYQTAYDNYENRYANITKAAERLGADFVIARTGQTYYFGDLEVLIVGSVDDMALTDFNDLDETSLWIKVSTPGKKLIFCGDAGGLYVTKYLLKRYTAATLKCDICQAASHGTNNAAYKDYYKLADPDVYLWPANLEFYNKHAPNSYVQGDTSAKILYAFKGTETVELN